jgi:SAM-dependent methyltransferase
LAPVQSTTSAQSRPASDTGSSECRWCGARVDAPDRPLAGRRVCDRCGVATTHPWPTDAELDAAYEGWYRPSSGRFQGPGDRLLRRLRSTTARRIAAEAPAGPVLDVGAGDGSLVDAFVALGRDATGLERDDVGHPRVRAGSIHDVDGEWSAIVFWHSLEHLRAPRPALDDACRKLVPGGLLVVAVPNAGSVQANVFGDDWFALDIPRHLVHLHPDALVERLEEQGMTVTRVSHTRGGQGLFGWLQGIVRTLPLHLDLYDAIRRPEARQGPRERWRPVVAALFAVAVLPAAAVAYAVETVVRRGGSVYIEARR